MTINEDPKHIPLLWINLDREKSRKARMDWAIVEGRWNAYRLNAIDAQNISNRLFSVPNPLMAGTLLPGLHRIEEDQPKRVTSRADLACLASWKHLILKAKTVSSPSGWILLMEDDLGASLAAPWAWAHSLRDLIEYCPKQTLAIQLAPISAAVRKDLATQWKQSEGKCKAVGKETVRSHGNGAVLVHQRALNLLLDPLLNLSYK